MGKLSLEISQKEASKVGHRDGSLREKKTFIRSDWRRKNWIWDGKNYPYPKQWKKNSNPTMLTSKHFLISFVEIPSWGQCSTPVCIARGATGQQNYHDCWPSGFAPPFVALEVETPGCPNNSSTSAEETNDAPAGAKAKDLSIFEPRAGNASFVEHSMSLPDMLLLKKKKTYFQAFGPYPYYPIFLRINFFLDPHCMIKSHGLITNPIPNGWLPCWLIWLISPNCIRFDIPLIFQWNPHEK